MADDDEILNIKLHLDEGDIVSASADASKKSSDAFEKAWKPKLEAVLPASMAQTGRRMLEGMELEKTLGSYVSGIKFNTTELGRQLQYSRDLENSISQVWGKGLDRAIQEGSARRTAAAAAPSAISPMAQQAAMESLMHRMAPVTAAGEGLAALLRTGSFATAAGAAAQPFLMRPSAPPRESAAEAIERRISGGPRMGETAVRPPGGGGFMAGVGRVAGAASVAGTAGSLLGPGAAIGGGIGAGIGALTPFPGGAIAGGVAGIIVGNIVEKLGAAVVDTAKHLEHLAVKGTETGLSLISMSRTMNVPLAQLFQMERNAAKAGVTFTDFRTSLQRLAVSAKQEMPEIARKVIDSANVMEEANIKVRDSERGVEKARDDRAAAGDRIKKSEGELAKFELTRAAEREQQARASDLGVSGAQIGLRGAQMQARQAALGLEFAPREAALADIQGKQTVKGAVLSTESAKFSLEEARIRAAGGDPSKDEGLQERKKAFAVRTAIHNVEQAVLHEKEAKLAEEKRERMIAEGVGPEAQAQQQYLSAGQAQAQAALAVDQAELARTKLVVDQQTTTLVMEQNELLRASNQAMRDKQVADEKTQEIAADRAQKDLDRKKYQEIPEIDKALSARARGEPVEGYDYTKIEQGAFRDTMFQRGGGNADKILEELASYIQGPAAGNQAEQLRRIRETFPGRRDESGQRDMLSYLKLTPEQRAATPDQLKENERRALELQSKAPELREFKSQVATQDLNEGIAHLNAELKAVSLGSGISALSSSIETSAQELKAKAIDAATDAAAGIKAAGVVLSTAIANALAPAAKTESKGGTASEIPSAPSGELDRQAAGGPISGPGSETSDDIPIMASRGEYMLQASAVRQVGVPFLNALNAGKVKLAEGGPVGERPVNSDDIQKGYSVDPNTGFLVDERGLVIYEGSVAERERKRLGLGRPTGPGWSFREDRVKHQSDIARGIIADKRSIPKLPPATGSTIRVLKPPTAETTDIQRRALVPGYRSAPTEATTDFQRRGMAPGYRSVPGEGSAPPSAATSPPSTGPKQIPDWALAPASWRRPDAPAHLRGKGQWAKTQAQIDAGDPHVGSLRGQGIAAPGSEGWYKQAAYDAKGVGFSITPEEIKAEVERRKAEREEIDTRREAAPLGGANAADFVKQYVTPSPPQSGRQHPDWALRPASWRKPDAPTRFETGIGTKSGWAKTQRQIDAGDPHVGNIRYQGIAAPGSEGWYKQAAADAKSVGYSITPEEIKATLESRRAEREEIDTRRESAPFGGAEYPSDARPFIYVPPPEPEKPALEEEKLAGQRREDEYAAGGYIGNLFRGFAGGGIITGAMASPTSGYTGGTSVQTGPGGDSALGYHQLDLRTDAGNITVAASDRTMEVIQRSSLGGRMSQTGPRPTWYS